MNLSKKKPKAKLTALPPNPAKDFNEWAKYIRDIDNKNRGHDNNKG